MSKWLRSKLSYLGLCVAADSRSTILLRPKTFALSNRLVLLPAIRSTDGEPYRATARDIITHGLCQYFRMARLSRGTNVRRTRAIDTTLLDFLYKWMALHLVYTIATLVHSCQVCKKRSQDKVLTREKIWPRPF